MAKPENTEFKKTTVVYVLNKDFNYSNTHFGRTTPGVLTEGTELRKGYVAMPTQGGLKWGDNLIPEGSYEIETVKTTFTRRKGKG